MGMAVRIVDQLQMVDVDEHDEQRLPDPVSTIDRLTELIAPRGARQHTGEVVPIRGLELFGCPVPVERRLLTVESGGSPVLGGGEPILPCLVRRRRVPGLGGLVASERGGVPFLRGSRHVIGIRPIGNIARDGLDRGRLLIHRVTGPSSAGSP